VSKKGGCCGGVTRTLVEGGSVGLCCRVRCTVGVVLLAILRKCILARAGDIRIEISKHIADASAAQ
jgi:hypothetical protein